MADGCHPPPPLCAVLRGGEARAEARAFAATLLRVGGGPRGRGGCRAQAQARPRPRQPHSSPALPTSAVLLGDSGMHATGVRLRMHPPPPPVRTHTKSPAAHAYSAVPLISSEGPEGKISHVVVYVRVRRGVGQPGGGGGGGGSRGRQRRRQRLQVLAAAPPQRPAPRAGSGGLSEQAGNDTAARAPVAGPCHGADGGAVPVIAVQLRPLGQGQLAPPCSV
eukprot:COSAG01_NODE_4230_length_5187_cov_2.551913_5_plen_221_part_00